SGGTLSQGVPLLEVRPRPPDALPLFTVRRPLAEGEVRNFSLFEPRFLRLFDQLKEAGQARNGLRLAVAYAPYGVEQPLGLWCQGHLPAPLLAEELPPLAVQVEVILDSQVRIVEVETIAEGLGEDQRRRWRLQVRGTSELLPTSGCGIFSDELGALWTNGRLDRGLEPSEAQQRQRVVAVVGLMHVNSMLQQLQTTLEDGASKQAEAAVGGETRSLPGTDQARMGDGRVCV
ncbi:unnamed protein product, partial [Effrenium voratum]